MQRNVKLSSEECFVKNVAIVRAIQSASEPSVPFKAGAFRKRQQTISFYRTKVLLLGLTAFSSQKSVTVKVVLSTRFDIEPKEKCFDLKPGFKLNLLRLIWCVFTTAHFALDAYVLFLSNFFRDFCSI